MHIGFSECSDAILTCTRVYAWIHVGTWAWPSLSHTEERMRREKKKKRKEKRGKFTFRPSLHSDTFCRTLHMRASRADDAIDQNWLANRPDRSKWLSSPELRTNWVQVRLTPPGDVSVQQILVFRMNIHWRQKSNDPCGRPDCLQGEGNSR